MSATIGNVGSTQTHEKKNALKKGNQHGSGMAYTCHEQFK